MGKRARPHLAEFELDVEEIRRRSDEILAIVQRVTSVEADAREAEPQTWSFDETDQDLEATGDEALPSAPGRPLVVREWLASQIGCAPRELGVIERRAEAFDVVFSRNGERYGEAYLLAPRVPGGWQGSIALIAVWKPGRWGQHILEPGTTVHW